MKCVCSLLAAVPGAWGVGWGWGWLPRGPRMYFNNKRKQESSQYMKMTMVNDNGLQTNATEELYKGRYEHNNRYIPNRYVFSNYLASHCV